jgi:hypothetical protein
MGQPGHGARLTGKPGAAAVELVVFRRVQDLDCDLAAQIGILGRVDPSHVARPDLAKHTVAPDPWQVVERRPSRRRTTQCLRYDLVTRRTTIEVELGRLELETREAPKHEGRDDVL